MILLEVFKVRKLVKHGAVILIKDLKWLDIWFLLHKCIGNHFCIFKLHKRMETKSCSGMTLYTLYEFNGAWPHPDIVVFEEYVVPVYIH